MTNEKRPRFGLNKTQIVRGRKLFREVFLKGKYVRGRWFDIVAFPVAHHESKVAFATARRVRRAVDRNKIKRRLREAFRLEQSVDLAHIVIFIGHEKILSLNLEALRREMRQTLLKLLPCFPTS